MTNFEETPLKEADKSRSLPVESIWELDKYFHDLKTNSILIDNFYDHKPDSKFPTFSDLSYRKRRHEITENAFKHKHGEPIPRIEYTQDELSTWKRVYTSLSGLIKRYACKEHLRSIRLFEKEGIYSPDWIPQLEDVSRFLQKKVGFQLRPVAGQISSRDFLEIISFRMFPCTQYLRHPLCVDHSPEPDIVHELLGHLPLMLSPGFADFFHQIGLLSLGLSDHDLNRLFTLFWWTIEWGMCREGDAIKAWGAAILSSPGEIKHAFSGAADFRELKWLRNDEDIVAFSFEDAQFQDEDFQSVYYVANSLIQGEKHLIDFIKQLKRPFKYRYEPITQSLERIDNDEIRRKIWREIVDNLDLLFELR